MVIFHESPSILSSPTLACLYWRRWFIRTLWDSLSCCHLLSLIRLIISRQLSGGGGGGVPHTLLPASTPPRPPSVSALPQGWHSYRYRKLITHNDSLVSITNYRKRQIGSRVSYPIPADLDDITLICMFTQTHTHTQRSTCCPALTCVSCSASSPEFVIFASNNHLLIISLSLCLILEVCCVTLVAYLKAVADSDCH